VQQLFERHLLDVGGVELLKLPRGLLLLVRGDRVHELCCGNVRYCGRHSLHELFRGSLPAVVGTECLHELRRRDLLGCLRLHRLLQLLERNLRGGGLEFMCELFEWFVFGIWGGELHELR
jgi:hypothetical protein